jgi:hypothetical protein
MLNNAQKEQICRFQGGLHSTRLRVIVGASANVTKSNYNWPRCTRLKQLGVKGRKLSQSLERLARKDARRQQELILDHFIRLDQQVLRHRNAKLVCRLQVDKNFEFGR